MKVFSPRFNTKEPSMSHAVSADFCRIFEKDMNRLYLLSFLLTADRALAEQCFVAGLEDSVNSNRVFQEWADSWARRTVIQHAIQMIEPEPIDRDVSAVTPDRTGGAQHEEIAAIVQLPAFERFVFVISALEGYSVQECSRLLDCTRAEVIDARTRALQQLGRSAELRAQTSIHSQQAQQQNAEPALPPQAASRLAAWA